MCHRQQKESLADQVAVRPAARQDITVPTIFEALQNNPNAASKFFQAVVNKEADKFVAPKQLEALFKRQYEDHSEPDFRQKI